MKSAHSVNAISCNTGDVVHSGHSLFLPVNWFLNWNQLWQNWILLTQLCVQLQHAGHALRWLLNYHSWRSRWLKAHAERQECVWEAPVGYKWHADVTFPVRGTCSLKSKLKYLSYLLAPGCIMCTTVDLSHSCRPSCNMSTPLIKHETKLAWYEN